MEQLKLWGWDAATARAFEPYHALGYRPGRITLEHTHLYALQGAGDDRLAQIAGKLRHEAIDRLDYPAVGDWVAYQANPEDDRAIIHAVLPRRTRFVRKSPGGGVQIVAANVDTVLLVNALNHDFNLRRLERYLTLAWESGAQPVVVLNKADLCDDIDQRLAGVAGVAPGVPVHAVSCQAALGLDQLEAYLAPGRTLALLGSSGVGKSSLLNCLTGTAHQRVQAVRDGDDRGRHTTTHRELVRLASGALVIDTPGMRELQLWDAADGLETAFEDVRALADACRFRDCRHRREPGCAVQDALAAGTLAAKRLASFEKLARELEHQARKRDPRQLAEQKARWKKLGQHGQAAMRAKREGGL